MARAHIVLQRPGDEDTLPWRGTERLTIGRLPSCDVVLEDSSISRHHAEILHAGSSWVIRDLGSTNGTLLNGVRLSRNPQRLYLGDHVQPGRVLLTITQLDEAASDDVATVPVRNLGDTFGGATAEFPVLADDDRVIGQELRDAPLETHRAGDPVRDFLTTSLRGAVDALAAQGGAVLLAEPYTPKLVVKASHRSGIADAAAPVHKCIQRAHQHGMPVLSSDSVNTEVVGAAGRSLLCLPLRDGERTLGVVCVERAAVHPFGDREQLLGQALAFTISAGVVAAQQVLEQQRRLFMKTMLQVAQAVDSRDPYTVGHTERVTKYVLMLAEELQVAPADVHFLQIGTPLHDIGKIGIDDAIRRKPGRLTPAEFATIKAHPSQGVAMLASVPDLEPVLPIIGSHHEHWDGSGYPDGLIGEIIPPLARMVAVADVFDALTSDRPFRKALTAAEAFGYLQRNAGTLLDPTYTQAFLRLRPQLEQRLRERGASA